MKSRIWMKNNTQAMRVTYVSVGIACVLFFIQILLFMQGFYARMWGEFFAVVRMMAG